jgi:phosphotransferase system HPr (HPr) family protein
MQASLKVFYLVKEHANAEGADDAAKANAILNAVTGEIQKPIRRMLGKHVAHLNADHPFFIAYEAKLTGTQPGTDLNWFKSMLSDAAAHHDDPGYLRKLIDAALSHFEGAERDELLRHIEGLALPQGVIHNSRQMALDLLGGVAVSKKSRREVRVGNRLGLHIRPCLAISRAASKFESTISVSSDQFSADAKSNLDLLMLAATQNALLVVSANGPDAAEAVQAITLLIGAIE